MAMAGKMVRPDCRVLAVCEDGGFMMNSQDLEIAVRLNLDFSILLLRWCLKRQEIWRIGEKLL